MIDLPEPAIEPDLKTERPVYYHMYCNCEYKKEDLIKIKSKMFCPIHKQPVEYKLKHCSKCGADIMFHILTSKAPDECEKCSPKGYARRSQKKTRRVKIKAISEENMELWMQRSSCVYRPLCIAAHFKAKELPCKKCQEFKEKDPMTEGFYTFDLKALDLHLQMIFECEDILERQVLTNSGKEIWGDCFAKRKRDFERKMDI